MANHLTDTRRVAICLATESNRPHEWLPVAWVVRNRVEANRAMFGGATYAGVITKRAQFSAFNGYTGEPDDIIERVSLETRNGTRLYPDPVIDLAEHCAAYVLGIPRRYIGAPGEHVAPVSPSTFCYWSPISMIPAGSLPQWDWSRLRRFSLPGIDPWRFMFAEEVR